MSKPPYRLAFELPGLPRMANPSGRRSHWAVIAREKRQWKTAVILQVGARRPAVPLKRAKLTLTRCSSASPDPDGLVIGFKPIVDALIAAGVIENDRIENIGMPGYRFEKAPPGCGKIRVEVEECPPGSPETGPAGDEHRVMNGGSTHTARRIKK